MNIKKGTRWNEYLSGVTLHKVEFPKVSLSSYSEAPVLVTTGRAFYCALVSLVEKGKTHQKSETFAKRKDAERRRHEVEYQMDTGIFKVAKSIR